MVDFISVGTDTFDYFTKRMITDELGDKALQVVYSYKEAPYEGTGYAAVKYEDRYDLVDISHCSCYGPEDQFERASRRGEYPTFEQVLESWTYADKDKQFLEVVEKCAALGWV